MIELIELLFKYLEQIPTNLAIAVMTGVIVLMFKRQEKTNKEFLKHVKESDDKFANGNVRFGNMEERFDIIDSHFLQVHEELMDVQRTSLKNIIYNDAMDYFERQNAYDDYIALGGNGFTQRYYNNILGPRIEEHIKQAELHKK